MIRKSARLSLLLGLLLIASPPASGQIDIHITIGGCCRFDDNYCHHVDDPKECQVERRRRIWRRTPR
jgi:hypothetical protein